MNAYSMGGAPDAFAQRKQALLKKLQGRQGGGQAGGGAARLTSGVPFGALPRLGFNPGFRAAAARPFERFTNPDPNILGGIQNAQQFGQQVAETRAPLIGVGPASPGASPGLPTQVANSSPLSTPPAPSVPSPSGWDTHEPGVGGVWNLFQPPVAPSAPPVSNYGIDPAIMNALRARYGANYSPYGGGIL